MEKFIILANGRTPGKREIRYLKANGYNMIICADGGANAAFRIGLIPDYIIGDFDSVKSDVLEYYRDKCKIKRISRQSDTDVEKSLKFAIDKGYNECCMLAVTGDRLDHSYGNLGIALKYSEKIKMHIISEQSYLSVISGKNRFRAHKGETVSLFGFDKSTKFLTRGLKYRLDNEALCFGISESVSNVAECENFEVEVLSGKAFIVRDFKIIKQFDLL